MLVGNRYMRRHRLIVCGILLLIIVGALVWKALFPTEPVYHGKTVSAWLVPYSDYIEPRGGFHTQAMNTIGSDNWFSTTSISVTSG